MLIFAGGIMEMVLLIIFLCLGIIMVLVLCRDKSFSLRGKFFFFLIIIISLALVSYWSYLLINYWRISVPAVTLLLALAVWRFDFQLWPLRGIGARNRVHGAN